MRPGELDLNLLWALDALLRERHVTRAGASIGVSQPAMSASLKRLRRVFSDPLLVKVGHELQLTPLGKDLEGPVRDLLRSIESVVEARPTFDPATSQRLFTIDASDYATALIIGPLSRAISAAAPDVKLEVRRYTDGIAFEDLDAGETDLILAPVSIATKHGKKLPSTPLVNDRWVCALSEDHHSVKEILSEDQYRELHHVVYSERMNPIAEPYPNAFRERNVRISAYSFFALPFLLVNTDLLCVLLERLAKQLIEHPGVRLVELPFPTEPMIESMLWHSRNTNEPGHVWLRGLLKEVCDELNAT